MERASICPEPCSTAAASRMTSRSDQGDTVRTLLTAGFPTVSVPVLSNTAIVIPDNASSAPPWRTMIPWRAA